MRMVVASLPIGLLPGQYIITSIHPNGYMWSNVITVLYPSHFSYTFYEMSYIMSSTNFEQLADLGVSDILLYYAAFDTRGTDYVVNWIYKA